jgi:hypothetical protein
MSFDFEQRPNLIGLGFLPIMSPCFVNSSKIALRASNLIIPENYPPTWLILPDSSNTLIISRPFLLAQALSL